MHSRKMLYNGNADAHPHRQADAHAHADAHAQHGRPAAAHAAADARHGRPAAAHAHAHAVQVGLAVGRRTSCT